ncbi:MAG: 2-dehydro-3-deoxygalactonokinase [Hylemonella sp.]
MTPSLLAVDWGTTSLRGALLDAAGQVIEERAFARGILSVPAGAFAATFEASFGDWLAATPGLRCLMAGMVGSRQGWQEAPYCACPAGFSDIVSALAWVRPNQIAIVPGLRCEQLEPQGDLNSVPVPDVMRGEETQVFGAMQALGQSDAWLVLPGTHSKWVRVQDARIQHFSTYMTGEIFALLRQHSILARTLPGEDADLDEAAFLRGVRRALASHSLLQTAFSARTLALFDQASPEQLLSYLSGLVIGEELRVQTRLGIQHVVLIANAALAHRYQLALAECGVSCDHPGAHITWTGLHAIAKSMNTP